MEVLMSYWGVLIFTTRIIYWVTGIGYVCVALASIVSLYFSPNLENLAAIGCSQQAEQLKSLTTWVFVTNFIGLVSAIMFFYNDKGSTISVIGSLVWLLNILQGLVLFIVAQVRLWSSEIQACGKAIEGLSEDTSAYKWQQTAVFVHILLCYLQLMIVSLASIFAITCIKGTAKLPNRAPPSKKDKDSNDSDDQLLGETTDDKFNRIS